MAIVGNAISTVTLKALVHVTTKPGATVTFKKGSTTMATKTANSSGVAELEVLSGDWGSWTIEGSASPSASGSASVTISAVTTYNVTLTLTQYIILSGNFVSGYSHASYGNSSYFGDEGSYIELRGYQGGSNANTFGYITTGIDMSYWKTLYIDCQCKGNHAYAGVSNSNSGESPSSFSPTVELCGKIDSWNTRATDSLNISSVTGTKYITLKVASWAEWRGDVVVGTGGNIRIWNLRLVG